MKGYSLKVHSTRKKRQISIYYAPQSSIPMSRFSSCLDSYLITRQRLYCSSIKVPLKFTPFYKLSTSSPILLWSSKSQHPSKGWKTSCEQKMNIYLHTALAGSVHKTASITHALKICFSWGLIIAYFLSRVFKRNIYIYIYTKISCEDIEFFFKFSSLLKRNLNWNS